MQYRREIDGLRALAVVPVILYHAGFAAFAGGFVGVDVFFVVSGYLITQQVAAAHQAGTFRLGEFWERRARRLLPALFAVLMACLPCAWATLTPAQMAGFSSTLVAVVLFGSNVFFWRIGNGYFGFGSAQPLLHTWSLAVEEQFYLLFPLAFGLLWRLGGGHGRRRLAGALAAVGIASLGLSAWGAGTHPLAAFFLLPTRAWEFIAGALLPLLGGVTGARPRRWAAHPRVAGAGAWAGLALIGAAVFGFDGATLYPGWRALAPVGGAVLLLLCAGPGNRVGRALALPLPVGLGLISYSAYLWHQPLFAFAEGWALRSTPLPAWARAGLCGLVLPLAYLSWRLVEQPFRQRRAGRWRIPGRSLWRRAWLAGLALCACGALGRATQGTLFRPAYVARGLPLEARLAFNMGLGGECLDYLHTWQASRCQTGAQPTVLVWGDSLAMHLVDGILASAPGAGVVQFARPFCGPLLGLAPVQPQQGSRWARDCLAANDYVVDYLRRHPSVRYVVLGSLFQQYLGPDAQLRTSAGAIVTVKGTDTALARAALARTLAIIRSLGKVPVIFAPAPTSGFDTGRCLVRTGIAGLPPSLCDFSPTSPDGAWLAPALTFLSTFARQDPVRLVWPRDGLCRAGVCRASHDGTLIYADSIHLSREGSRWLGRQMDFYGRITGQIPGRVTGPTMGPTMSTATAGPAPAPRRRP